MTMGKALHPKCDIEKLYESIKEARRSTGIEDSMDSSIRALVKKKQQRKTFYDDQKQYKQPIDQKNNY